MRYYLGLILIAVVMAFSAGYLALYARRAPKTPFIPIPSLGEFKQSFRSKARSESEIDLGKVLATGERSELLDPASKLPRSFIYDYKNLKALYEYANSCKPAFYKKPKSRDPLAKSWLWHSYICNETRKLPADFFIKPPLIHPSGASFAWLAYQSRREPFQSRAWLDENISLFHITEAVRVEPVSAGSNDRKFLVGLGASALAAIARGAETVLSERYFLLRSNESFDLAGDLKYSVYPRSELNRFLADSPFSISIGTAHSTCFHREGNLCWTANVNHFSGHAKSSFIVFFGGALFLTFSLIGLLLKKIHDERRVDQARQFALQTLTHELRTPITSMMVSIENLRPRFDSLNAEAQEVFLRNCDDLQRLKRLTEASTQYLKLASPQSLIHFQKVQIDSLSRFIESALDPYLFQIQLEFGHNTEEGAEKFCFDPYWVGISLKNLVENALTHGSAPVVVRTSVDSEGLKITVQDQGRSEYTELERMIEPFRRSGKSSGLGLGLSIVQQILTEMGGKLCYLREPTRFSLVIPREAR